MYLLFANPASGFIQYYPVATNQAGIALAAELQVPVGDYAIFANLNGLPTGWENFPQGLTLTLTPTPAYGYAMPGAKNEASVLVKLNNYAAVEQTCNGWIGPLLAAQATLPEVDRIPEVQSVITQQNVLADTLQSKLIAIAAATTPTQLEAITDIQTGILSTGRGGAPEGENDLNPSFYVEFNSETITEAQTQLYIPGTNTTLSYGQYVPGQFDSPGTCFNPGDYRVQIRVVATGVIIAQFECPLAPVNVDVTF
jgi:hypothetical protein